MRKTIVCAALALVAAYATGCASSMMLPTELKTKPAPGKALVTFFRPTRFGGAIKFGIWDKENFVGIVTPKAVLQYECDPGEHLLMARAENWDYCKAKLEADKNYYIIARVKMGVWKARVSLDPIRTDDKETSEQIQAWLKGRPITVDPMKRDAYVTRHLPDTRRGIDNFNTKKPRHSEMMPGDSR